MIQMIGKFFRIWGFPESQCNQSACTLVVWPQVVAVS